MTKLAAFFGAQAYYSVSLHCSLKHSGALLGSNSMRNKAVMLSRIQKSDENRMLLAALILLFSDMRIAIPCQEKPGK